MTRQEAEIILQRTFKLSHFYDEQWTTIERILKGERVLLIEKTGFGKSLCFQFPAILHIGTTVIFSPLIALMRDQVKKLNSLGILAKCVNSEQTPEENSQIITDAKAGKIKILYIAPERQENSEWIEATRQMNLSMVVVDEAHCISVWGHDFRPAFRRIINLVNLLPKGLPVLATTATATKKVEADIAQQMGSNLTTIRGNLMRDNFKLFVIKVSSEDEKLIWLGQNLQKLPGSGILYTGTRVDTEIYSKWFEFLKIPSTGYNAGLDPDSRIAIENGLMKNQWKCVISTNALGMGIDKPDIRFIIHTQIPQSPIHYYQEIGRAGRDNQPSYIILFYNPEDKKLPEAFIEGGRPAISKYEKVIIAVKSEMLGERDLMRRTNLKQNQIRVIKADLMEQKIIREVTVGHSKKFEYITGAPQLNTKAFEELRASKTRDLDKMIEYVETTQSRMKYLCDYLGDSSTHFFNNCDNTGLKKIIVSVNDKWTQKLQAFREDYFPVLEVETRGTNLTDGIAASYYGVSNVGSALHRSKYENGGDFPDFLLRLILKAYRKKFGQEKFDLILYVPPTKSGELVKNFAVKVSQVLKFPISHNLVKQRTTSEQKVFENGYLKSDNVKDAFLIRTPDEVRGKSILLIDDIFDSGATIKEIGRYLSNLGAIKIAPLTIAKTVGGDLSTIHKKTIINNTKFEYDFSDFNNSEENIYNKIFELPVNVTVLKINGVVDEKERTIGFITNLAFLKNFTKIKKVYLSHNHIRDLSPIKNLSEIEILDLGDNDIEKINDIENLSNLKELHLYHNRLEEIAILGYLIDIEVLSLAYNKIFNINYLKACKNLKWLSLCGNPISDISVLFSIPSLEVVTLSHTLVAENDIRKLSEKGIETSWYWYEFWH